MCKGCEDSIASVASAGGDGEGRISEGRIKPWRAAPSVTHRGPGIYLG
ncbi:unnamed protein product [Mycetohabitans rhizoxinica HKI 454]|uniref:Uncharacterized protein n=1 Tax=Mycetohabitans rhizoxinica (strain DSM 19002 / CIP 109453 / HKI 454) TaxID=882378 RepID=E5ANE8_MYCRK|nr:unnamed protein product [Mycetohabitans rhizoxinica HKI 454]